MARRCGCVAVILLACLVTGCSRGGPRPVPVVGRVTFEGASPPARCELYFVPSAADDASKGMPQRAGRAITDADGTFRASSLREGDGLLPGRYEVRLVCWRTPPNSNHQGGPDTAGVSFVPVGFVPPALVIEQGDRRTVRYELDVPTTPLEADNAKLPAVK